MLKIIKIHQTKINVHCSLCTHWDFLLPYLCSSHIFTCDLYVTEPKHPSRSNSRATSSLKPFLISLVFTTGHTASGWLISFFCSLLPLNYNGVLFCFSYYSFSDSFINSPTNPCVYSTNFKDFLDHTESMLCAGYNNGHRDMALSLYDAYSLAERQKLID